MKTAKLQNVPATVLLVVGLASASSAQAINENLAATPQNAIDGYVLNCPVGTEYARARVKEISSPTDANRVELEFEYTGDSDNCDDSPLDAGNGPDVYFNQTADNDGSWVNTNSGYVELHCGAGQYDIVVSHTQGVAENYRTDIQCRENGVVPPIPPNPDE